LFKSTISSYAHLHIVLGFSFFVVVTFEYNVFKCCREDVG